MDEKLNEAFETFRTNNFGTYEAYPVDAFTYFGCGWKVRDVELAQLRGALTQIREVCKDNAAAACNQAMALTFVHSVAVSALSTDGAQCSDERTMTAQSENTNAPPS